jgi:hypothetical protein
MAYCASGVAPAQQGMGLDTRMGHFVHDKAGATPTGPI